jgi:Peptidase S24-like
MMSHVGIDDDVSKSKRNGKLAEALEVPVTAIYNWRRRDAVPNEIVMRFCSKYSLPVNTVLYEGDGTSQAAGLVAIDGPAPDKPIQNLSGGDDVDTNESRFAHEETDVLTAHAARAVAASRRVRAHVHGPSLSRMDTRDNVDRFMSDRPDESMFFRVMDDALYGVGIVAGDMVVVDPSCTPQRGDVVVVQLYDGQVIVRKFEPPYLVSYYGDVLTDRTEDYFYPSENLTLVGVVVTFARRIH